MYSVIGSDPNAYSLGAARFRPAGRQGKERRTFWMIVTGEAPSPSHRCSPSAATAGEDLGREPPRIGSKARESVAAWVGPEHRRLRFGFLRFRFRRKIDERRMTGRTGGTQAATLSWLSSSWARMLAILRFDFFGVFFTLTSLLCVGSTFRPVSGNKDVMHIY